MSSRRRNRGNSDFSFDGLKDNDAERPEMSTSEFTNRGYNSTVADSPFAKVSKSKIVSRDLDRIWPDVRQPRRAIPSTVRGLWNGQSDFHSMSAFFTAWFARVDEARSIANQVTYPLRALLLGDDLPRTNAAYDEQLDQVGGAAPVSVEEVALHRLVTLAASIHRDGLTNPISLVHVEEGFRIETGERRWLSYHLLHWQFPDEEDWLKIPARIVEEASIWRQASENNAREDLNAVQQARQFALLLMDLRDASDYGDFASFDNEQDFYGQVKDGNLHRIPTGQAEAVMNAMGVRDAGQLRHIRRILRLPNIVWVLADDLDWSEHFIQKTILRGAENDEEMIRRAVRAAVAEGYTVSALTDYQHYLDADDQPNDSKQRYNYEIFADSFTPKLLKAISRLQGDDRQRAIEHLERMLNELRSA